MRICYHCTKSPRSSSVKDKSVQYVEGVLFITAAKSEVTGDIQDRTEVFLKLPLLHPDEGAKRQSGRLHRSFAYLPSEGIDGTSRGCATSDYTTPPHVFLADLWLMQHTRDFVSHVKAAKK
jgi:hypothetical protein